MIDLLELTVAAHGRLDRYNQFKTVSAHLGLGGRMWVLKGHEKVTNNPRVRVTVDLHREYARQPDNTPALETVISRLISVISASNEGFGVRC